MEKINKLENELNLEKTKNKEYEKQLIDLKNELNNKINLESSLREKEKPINIEFKNESKEKFMKQLWKKIKKLKN